jgi:multiple sugar transport system substrate-binding protein
MFKVYKGKQAAMMWMHHLFIVGNELPDSPIKGLSGYARIPAGANTIGGWTAGINKNSANPEASWEFVRWMTGPEMAKTLFVGGGATTRSSILSNPGYTKDYPFLPALLVAFKESQNRASACPTCPGIVPEAEYELKVGEQASAVISGQKLPKQAADDSAKILDKLLKDFGYA